MNNTFQKTSPSTGNSLPTIALHNAVIDVKINIINEYVPIKSKVVLKLINIQNKIAITITIPNIIFPKCLYIFYLNYFFFSFYKYTVIFSHTEIKSVKNT